VGEVRFRVTVGQTDQILELVLPRKPYDKDLKVREDDRLQTAYHEAAHEIVRKILFGDLYESTFLAIIPGVVKMQRQWIHYAGIARAEALQHAQGTRGFVLGMIAVKLAGAAAQRLITLEGEDDAGKSHDNSEASEYARMAILHWGLSEKWGDFAPTDRSKTHEFIMQLSRERRTLLDREVSKLLKEGRQLADTVQRMNFTNALAPMAVWLGERGKAERDDIRGFYSRHSLNTDIEAHLDDPVPEGPKRRRVPGAFASLKPALPRPQVMANIEAIAQAERHRQVSEVELSREIWFFDGARHPAFPSLAGGKCQGQVLGAEYEI